MHEDMGFGALLSVVAYLCRAGLHKYITKK